MRSTFVSHSCLVHDMALKCPLLFVSKMGPEIKCNTTLCLSFFLVSNSIPFHRAHHAFWPWFMDSSVVESRTHDQNVASSSPGRSGRVNFCADSHFSICSTHVLLPWHMKDPGHSAKSAGGRLQLNTHAPCACGFK